MNFNDSEVIIFGGTGSLGKALTKLLLDKYRPKGIRIFSRSEFNQWEMQKQIIKRYGDNIPISFLIGDIRDRKRVELASKGTNIIINCAALKQIGACELNPLEAIETNITGTQNVLSAALENKVEKVMHISTDKACEPWTLYGATKTVAEKLIIQGNTYAGGRFPKLSCCRYGNIASSRGSVIPLFKEQAKTGTLTITSKYMTRFLMTISNVAQFVIDRIEDMEGGEIFIPYMNSCYIYDLAKYIAPNAKIKEIGIRGDEKLHEILIVPNEELKTMPVYSSDLKHILYYEIAEKHKNKFDIKDINYESDDLKYIKPIEFFKELIEDNGKSF